MKVFFHNASNRIINYFRQSSIFVRLLGVMLCLSIIPTFFISCFCYNRYVSQIQDNAEQYLSLLIKNVSTQIQAQLENYEYTMRAFYANPQIIKLVEENEQRYTAGRQEEDPTYLKNKKSIQENLWKLSSGNRYILNFELITDTQEYTSIGPDGCNFGAILQDADSFRKSDFYQKAIENEGYPVWFDTTANRELIHKSETSTCGIGNTFTVTTAIYPSDRKGPPIGVLMMNVDTNFLSYSLMNYGFYGTGNTVLVTDHVLTALNPNVDAPSLPFDQSLYQTFTQMQHGDISKTVNGRTQFICFRKCRSLDLYIAHIVDMDVLLEPAYHIWKLCNIILIILIFLCFLVANLTTRSISIPLNELLNNIKAFKQNWSAQRCRISGNDELTQISSYFNSMADSTVEMSNQLIEEKLRQKSLELSRTQAELNALQMQINPHLLYNTLDLIRWETIRLGNGENDASRMIDRFTELLRKSIKKGENKVPIQEELEHAKSYLEVVNFGRSNKIELVCSMDFSPEKYVMPKLSLQPLIENAVKHGLQKGVIYPTIRLRGRLISNQSMVITITDNGRGMPQEALDALRCQLAENATCKDGIGLRNVSQRFLLLYGKDYGLTIDSLPDMGTNISLHFPLEPV